MPTAPAAPVLYVFMYAPSTTASGWPVSASNTGDTKRASPSAKPAEYM
jgi:hypothetical protein